MVFTQPLCGRLEKTHWLREDWSTCSHLLVIWDLEPLSPYFPGTDSAQRATRNDSFVLDLRDAVFTWRSAAALIRMVSLKCFQPSSLFSFLYSQAQIGFYWKMISIQICKLQRESVGGFGFTLECFNHIPRNVLLAYAESNCSWVAPNLSREVMGISFMGASLTLGWIYSLTSEWYPLQGLWWWIRRNFSWEWSSIRPHWHLASSAAGQQATVIFQSVSRSHRTSKT